MKKRVKKAKKNRNKDDRMKLIVGLGNPGRKYENTPHNIGFEVVDELAWRNSLKWRRSRLMDAEFCDGYIEREDCMLLKPTTYMNNSGEAIAPLVRGEGLDISRDLLLIYDDVALPLGMLRLRAKGSSAGHNGVQSVIDHLKSPGFPRLRCGVGPREDDDRARDILENNRVAYVLAKWPKATRPDVDAMKNRGADAVERWLTDEIERVMNEVNRKV